MEEIRESSKNNKKTCQKGGLPALGVTLKRWLTPKSWSTPEEKVKFYKWTSTSLVGGNTTGKVNIGHSCFGPPVNQ